MALEYDERDPDKRIALEMASDTLGDLSSDSRLDGAERDAIGTVRQIIDEILEGQRP